MRPISSKVVVEVRLVPPAAGRGSFHFFEFSLSPPSSPRSVEWESIKYSILTLTHIPRGVEHQNMLAGLVRSSFIWVILNGQWSAMAVAVVVDEETPSSFGVFPTGLYIISKRYARLLRPSGWTHSYQQMVLSTASPSCISSSSLSSSSVMSILIRRTQRDVKRNPLESQSS